MPADIATIQGKPAIAYYGETPWHGLGQVLQKPATAAEAIAAAQLDWDVTKVPLHFRYGGSYLPVPNRYGIVRADRLPQTGLPPVLGIVGKEYRPLQNREAFAWFDPIVGEGAAIYHTAGALGDGERVWLLAKLPGELQVIGDDSADKFLLLSNSHDGSSSVQIKFTPVRVVCQNTLTMALRGGSCLNVPHTRALADRLKAARDTLGIINRRFEDITADFRSMAFSPVSSARLAGYLAEVFPEPAREEDDRARSRVKQARQESARLFEEGKGNAAPGVRGTLWAAYNGVAEFVDYAIRYRNADCRLDAVWFGSGYLSKARAFRLATDKSAAWRN
jgi:phage/plasmid-like protein (TIGR03299 family)